MGAVSPSSSTSARAASTASLRREIGTQASVGMPWQPGRSASAAHHTSWRACQSRLRASGVSAQAKPTPPCSAASSSATRTCCATLSGAPWNSRNKVGMTGSPSFA